MSAALHPVATVATLAVPNVITVITPPRVQPCTAAQMATQAGVSRRMIFLGLKVKRAGCSGLHQMIRDGRVSMSLAASLADMFSDHDDQRTVLAEFATLPARQWLGFARRVRSLMNDGPVIPPKTGPFNTPENGVVGNAQVTRDALPLGGNP